MCIFMFVYILYSLQRETLVKRISFSKSLYLWNKRTDDTEELKQLLKDNIPNGINVKIFL